MNDMDGLDVYSICFCEVFYGYIVIFVFCIVYCIHTSDFIDINDQISLINLQFRKKKK